MSCVELSKKDIYILKSVAIFCVVCAHCGNRISHSQVDVFLEQVRNMVAGIGVPVFFIVSGYLFNNQKKIIHFWKKKLVSVIIPWLFWGIIIWGYQVIRKGLDYMNIIEWLLGINTYLWYMRTIIIFWFFLFFVKNRCIKWIILYVSVLCRVTVCFTMAWQFDNMVINNVLCYLFFFALGICTKDINQCEEGKRKKLFFVLLLACILEVFLPMIIGYGLPDVSLLYILTVMFACIKIAKKYNGIFSNKIVEVGKNSYLIYLIHMPVAGVVSNLFSRKIFLLYLVLVQPIIVIVFTECVVELLKKMLKNRKKIRLLTGIGD